MSTIRWIVIKNFRGIKKLSWKPRPGINCIIGPGDSSKSTILDAIDICLGARRNINILDTDFYGMDTSSPININLLIGDLPDDLMTLDSYGIYLQGFDPINEKLHEEPGTNLETVLKVAFTVGEDLEPSWRIRSKRSDIEGIERQLTWKEKTLLSPTRIGTNSEFNLSWRRGSILNKLSEERAEATSTLVQATRDARAAFGIKANTQLADALTIVSSTANDLGVNLGGHAQALLDTHSVSFGSGTIALHDSNGIPLKNLGVGSSRLLISGLQRNSSEASTITLADELEYGLEPHRIVSLLRSLGSKDLSPKNQIFSTTHSPIALRELNGDQVTVVRRSKDEHFIQTIGSSDDIQGTLRLFPEAFLAKHVIICEGATEIGFMRGLDIYRSDQGKQSLTALGASLINIDGGTPDRAYSRALSFQNLGYRVMIIRDSDVPLKDPDKQDQFEENNGTTICWSNNYALEQQLFMSLPDEACIALLEFAKLKHDDLVNEHLSTVSSGKTSIQKIQEEIDSEIFLSIETREILGRAANQKRGWFKNIGIMEEATRSIIAPALPNSEPDFLNLINKAVNWVGAGID